MLTVTDLNKHYGKKQALADLNMTFDVGIYGLLGPNGAGKSTLMNIISDNLAPDSGSKILWDGEDITKLGSQFRAKVGYMPQQQSLYDNFTARRFMMYIAALKGIPTRSAREQTESLLKSVELDDVADKHIGSFSGGMKQRVLVAQALLGDPKLVLLDEPTAGLDPKQRVIIRNLIHSIAKDKTVLVSTHIVSDVESIADKIIIMKQGRIAASGSVEELCAALPEECRDLENAYMKYFPDESTEALADEDNRV